jgi:hypothetical protein
MATIPDRMLAAQLVEVLSKISHELINAVQKTL